MMPRIGVALATSVITLTVCVHRASSATIELRGAQPAIVAERASIEPDGVRVTTTGGVTTVVAWDRVRSLTGVDNPNDAAAWLPIAEDLWRARSRVQRGDTLAASPLFERHFPQFRGTTSETALVVAEGLLRCRLASQDWMQAIVPALEVARLRKAGATTDRYTELDPVIDDTTLLCPQLAPAWTPDDRTKAIAEEIEALHIGESSVGRIAGLYVLLLRGSVPVDELKRDDAPAVALLHAIARLNGSDDAARARAAKDLVTPLKTLPEWARAWANHAIGRAAITAKEPAAQMDGVLALVRVAAQPSSPRRLARSSLDLAIPALRALGDADGAAALERERSALGGPKASAPAAKPRKAAPPEEPRRAL